MELNNNIFCATNPAKISDALWHLMMDSGVDVADMLIFLPSRRAVRSVEKMIAEGVDTFVEIGPGKTLAGFIKKINPEVKVVNISCVADLQLLTQLQ